MSADVELEWTYTPPDYFEGSLQFKINETRVDIDTGRVSARLPANVYDQDEQIRGKLFSEIMNRFRGAQLVNQGSYQLSGMTERRMDAQGRVDQTVHMATLEQHVSLGERVDIQIRDPDGTVTGDTKADRIARTRRMSQLVAKHAPNDATLRSMLDAHDAAMKDPANELVHLYEIPDALKKRFTGEARACRAIGIDKKQQWSPLGGLANDPLIRQGRHRGQNPGQLRDATQAELQAACAIASEMIVAYLNYLERHS